MIKDEPYNMMKRIITGYNSEYEENFLESKSEKENEDEKIEIILEQSSYQVYKTY